MSHSAGTTAPPAAAPLIGIEGLTVRFSGTAALRGIDLEIRRGEAVGLVGESGSGKSVTWLAALGLLPRRASVSGRVTMDGDNLVGASETVLDRVRGGRIAMVFQDPASALNPVMQVGRQVGEVLARHRGLSGAAAEAEALRLLDLVGIPAARQRLRSYPHEFSGGQNQRVMIAIALAGQPDLLVADEPTTALDATIQAQILDLLRSIRQETGMAMVLISHDLGVVAQTCDRVAVMYAGRIVEEAPTALLFRDPAHPYTRGLIGALPRLKGPRARLTAISGTVPDPADLPSGCAFRPRCLHAGGACAVAVPKTVARGAGHTVACLLPAPAEIPVVPAPAMERA